MYLGGFSTSSREKVSPNSKKIVMEDLDMLDKGCSQTGKKVTEKEPEEKLNIKTVLF